MVAAEQMKPCSVKIVKIQEPSAQPNNISSEKQRIYNCKFCNMTSRIFKKVDNHIRAKHPDKTVFKCDYAACLHLFFGSEEEKRTHLETLHSSNSDGPKVEKCVYCGQISIDRKGLWSHMMIVHKNVMVRCNYTLCAAYLKSEADRQQHMEEKHPVSADAKKCVYCGEWVRFMRQHVRNLHSKVTIKCNYSIRCCNFFINIRDREEHIKKVHFSGNMRQKKECFYCGESYPDRDRLWSHIQRAHNSIAVKCRFIKCGKWFKTHEEYDRHFKEMHQDKEKLKNISCHLCNYKTSDKSCLKQHWQAQHGSDSFKCSQCPSRDRIYRSIGALNHHIQTTHLEIKTCPHCNKSIHKHALKSHLTIQFCAVCKINYQCIGVMTKHKKLCRRKCEICEQKFAGKVPLLMHITKCHKNINVKKLTWLGDLQRHMSKNLKCEKCERFFYNAVGLRRHVFMMHGWNRPQKTCSIVVCHFCKKEFGGRLRLERHIIYTHFKIRKRM
jgi:hypothetical protein